VQRETNLLHVVLTLRSASSFAGLLNCWQQQGDQNRDDGNHHQQFDQCKSTTFFSSHQTSPENDGKLDKDSIISGKGIQLLLRNANKWTLSTRELSYNACRAKISFFLLGPTSLICESQPGKLIDVSRFLKLIEQTANVDRVHKCNSSARSLN
jgi:hypothetical protein